MSNTVSVLPKPGEIKLAPGRWTYKEFNDMFMHINRGEFQQAAAIAAKGLVAWGFNAPVNVPKPFSGLKFAEGMEVLRAIPALCKDWLDSAEAEAAGAYTADLTAWSFDEFSAFQEASSQNDIDAVEKAFRQVVRLNGEALPEGDLNYLDGGLAMRVVMDSVKKVIEGKN